MYRLGSLSTAGPLNEANPNGKILLAALAQRGYVVGRNLSYDARGAMGDVAKVREHMAEFKAANVDVVVAVGYPVAVAAKALQIPTVMLGEPVIRLPQDSLTVWRVRVATSRACPTWQPR
jgi:putative ABC transport system substrate-binding protein